MFIKTIFDGFKFGLILQFSIGPVCLFILNEANSNGFISAQLGVLAVVLIDLFFVILAISGISSLFNNIRFRKYLLYFGFFVLFIFGLDMILSAFKIHILLSLNIPLEYHSSFIKGIILTGSNPLTLLFWSGIFSMKLIKDNYIKHDMYLFGIGAVLATLIFLTVVSLLGIVISGLMDNNIIVVLNTIIGLILIFYAFRLLIVKRNDI